MRPVCNDEYLLQFRRELYRDGRDVALSNCFGPDFGWLAVRSGFASDGLLHHSLAEHGLRRRRFRPLPASEQERTSVLQKKMGAFLDSRLRTKKFAPERRGVQR